MNEYEGGSTIIQLSNVMSKNSITKFVAINLQHKYRENINNYLQNNIDIEKIKNTKTIVLRLTRSITPSDCRNMASQR